MKTLTYTLLLLAFAFQVQRSAPMADYLAEGGDPQRTGWVQDEEIFSATNVGTMKLLWKTKLDTPPREMHNLFPPLIVGKVETSQGEKQIAVVAGISDTLYGIDVESGAVLWSRKFDTTYTPAGGRGAGTLCPGGQTAVPVVGPGDGPGKYTIY